MEMESHRIFPIHIWPKSQSPYNDYFNLHGVLESETLNLLCSVSILPFIHKFKSRINRICHLQFELLTAVHLNYLRVIYISICVFLRFGVSRSYLCFDIWFNFGLATLFFFWLWWKTRKNSSFELIKWLHESDRFANQFQLKNASLDNKSVKCVQKLDKIFLYKQVMSNGQLLSGTEALIYVLWNSKSTFLWKDYFIKAAGLGLYDILLPHAFQINI